MKNLFAFLAGGRTDVTLDLTKANSQFVPGKDAHGQGYVFSVKNIRNAAGAGIFEDNDEGIVPVHEDVLTFTTPEGVTLYRLKDGPNDNLEAVKASLK